MALTHLQAMETCIPSIHIHVRLEEGTVHHEIRFKTGIRFCIYVSPGAVISSINMNQHWDAPSATV